jgi:hypothetical protein
MIQLTFSSSLFVSFLVATSVCQILGLCCTDPCYCLEIPENFNGSLSFNAWFISIQVQ